MAAGHFESAKPIARVAIDAVLLDYDMPEMMGDEIAEILKREHPQLPIIILSRDLLFAQSKGQFSEGVHPKIRDSGQR